MDRHHRNRLRDVDARRFVYSIYYRLAPFLMGPEIRTFAHFVHVVAFAVLGALFTFAYPGRILVVSCIVIGGAGLLEIAQTLTPDRHGTLIDALEKMAAVGPLEFCWSRRSNISAPKEKAEPTSFYPSEPELLSRAIKKEAIDRHNSVAVEYDHLFMGNRDVSFISRGVLGIGVIAPGAVFRTDRISQDVDMITARINYRFGGPGLTQY